MTDADQYTEAFAQFYEATHRDREVGDETFYTEAARDANGPVLEGACGTGRLYLELLRAGVDADGFDVSPAMLDILRDTAADEGLDPSVWQGDLRSPGANRTYELVFVPYNSLAALTTVEDQLAGLRALYDLLEPDGRLLFDAFVPRYEVIAESFGEWQPVQEVTYDGETLRGRTKTTVESEVAQTYRGERQLLSADDEVVATESYVSAHLPPQQVELLARRSPFETWTSYGGFDGEPLEDGASVQVWELEREG